MGPVVQVYIYVPGTLRLRAQNTCGEKLPLGFNAIALTAHTNTRPSMYSRRLPYPEPRHTHLQPKVTALLS